MPKKPSDITSTDQFCGAGGSTDGLMAAAHEMNFPVRPMVGLNHWSRAIETYGANWPNALLDCTDISASDPRRYPSTNILLTSPECTNHSLAKGKKRIKTLMDYYKQGILDPGAQRSRATMWDVPRFAEYHNYDIIITENVIDAYHWVMFEAWLKAMYCLNYRHEIVFANSKFFWPTPQSRDRMYVVFWKKGNKKPDLRFTPVAHCSFCSKQIEAVQVWKSPQKQYGIYGKRGQYTYNCPNCSRQVEPYYYAAFNAIDWTDQGRRIGDMKKQLVDNTKTRIQYGIDKYGTMPFSIQYEHSSNLTQNINPLSKALPVQATRQTAGMVLPFIVNTMHGGEHQHRSRSVTDPLFVQTTYQAQMLVNLPYVPFMVENKGQSLSRSVLETMSTNTTVVSHGVCTTEAWNSFISYYYRTPQATAHYESFGTMPTKERMMVVNYQKPNIEDCYYRMLKPAEGKKAMAFADSHIITGDSREQFRQLGNAVTPPVMREITKRCIQTLL